VKFRVRLEPYFEAHSFDAGSPAEVDQVLADFEAGRDASIFGALELYRMRFPDLDTELLLHHIEVEPVIDMLGEALALLRASSVKGEQVKKMQRLLVKSYQDTKDTTAAVELLDEALEGSE